MTGLYRLVVAAAIAATATSTVAARPRPGRAPPPTAESFGAPWTRIPATPGGVVEMRPFPPRQGRNRCIAMDNIAGAQLFGDSALELNMRNGRHYRLFFERECPALSFYQGFYYRRQVAGQICAGRDSIGARSGGECRIASIIELRTLRKTR